MQTLRTLINYVPFMHKAFQTPVGLFLEGWCGKYYNDRLYTLAFPGTQCRMGRSGNSGRFKKTKKKQKTKAKMLVDELNESKNLNVMWRKSNLVIPRQTRICLPHVCSMAIFVSTLFTRLQAKSFLADIIYRLVNSSNGWLVWFPSCDRQIRNRSRFRMRQLSHYWLTDNAF